MTLHDKHRWGYSLGLPAVDRRDRGSVRSVVILREQSGFRHEENSRAIAMITEEHRNLELREFIGTRERVEIDCPNNQADEASLIRRIQPPHLLAQPSCSRLRVPTPKYDTAVVLIGE